MSLRFTEDHEWIRVDGDVGTVGITHHAQEQLGDLVFAELPETGASLEQGAEACVVESTKAASEVYAPVAGEVLEVNEALGEDPGKINSDPMGDGWLMKIKISDAAQLEKLMDEDAYKKFVEGLE
jgi:glycine cleavage system H protein